MARKREFDADEALERAIEVFHRKGFASTSMRDLVDHMGIGRGSLYETFGSKEQLFVRALTRYADRSLEGMVACLEDADDPLEGIRDLLHKVVDNHAGSVVLGQDLRVGYAGFDGIHYQLFVCESMVLRLDEPGAVCVVTD